jgi:hypothetical protein
MPSPHPLMKRTLYLEKTDDKQSFILSFKHPITVLTYIMPAAPKLDPICSSDRSYVYSVRSTQIGSNLLIRPFLFILYPQHPNWIQSAHQTVLIYTSLSGYPESCHPNPWPIRDSDQRNPKYFVSTERKLLEPLITTFAVNYWLVGTKKNEHSGSI